MEHGQNHKGGFYHDGRFATLNEGEGVTLLEIGVGMHPA